ncbi:regulatory subunit of cyclin-dependent kinase [Kockovaella imperatae]|uniref:Cyclin-dependent kinases regulatory subunit n=1 Tax=Kockovaella imperatae TaxID=4999 RepID=A0A1Y1UP39_9TREE|nr:regulatory subunit of cyclin-dependent kinase [Kockovaella imperatae]ORX39274.1 regulatory subunit of cyclin-dependent kinase [Kockovaella imperatae]
MSKYNQKPFTQEEKRKAIEQYSEKIQYSARYSNDEWEYRHVIIPKPLLRFTPPGVCPEDVWRGLGIRQSPGWEMYMRHDPEPHVLLFRRPKNYDLIHPPFSAVGAARLVNVGKN